ncbi:MAG: hypothetical protein JWP04_448 [Belnapia sp.]|nr:hypothetical protein [Belnapia sp.]
MIFVRRSLYELTSDGWAVLHLVVSAVPAWFCLVLSWRGDTFATGGGAFVAMAAVASEHTWALVSGIVAVMGGSAWWTRSWPIWVGSTVILSAWHGLVALLVFQANPIGTGAGTYALLALAATIKVMRPVEAHTMRQRHAHPHR